MSNIASPAATLPPPPAETLAAFTAIVGERNVVAAGADQERYLKEWRFLYRGQTPLVLKPANTDEVSRIMALANETRTAIVPQGGNTGLVGGQISHQGEVVLSLERMNRVRSVDPVGNTIVVEAGVTLQGVQQAAEDAGRLFPLSIGSQGTCQIGGNLSTNAGGIQVLAYGNARALVLGLEVVMPDGRVWDGLRALRKDNTGYDLRDLFIGAEGTLGIITAAVLKMFPRPKSKGTAIVGLTDIERAARFFDLAYEMGAGELTAFEILSRMGIEMVLRHDKSAREPLAEPYPWYVLFDLSSQREDEAESSAEKLLMAAIESGIVADARLATSLAQGNELWRLREWIVEAQHYEGGSIKSDVSVPVAAIPDFITRANDAATAIVPGCRPVPFGHYGDGNIHFNISQPVGMERAAFIARWNEVTDAINAIVADLNGSISAEHGIGFMKRDLLREMKSSLEIELMRRIKDAFDPNGILNPGKVV